MGKEQRNCCSRDALLKQRGFLAQRGVTASPGAKAGLRWCETLGELRVEIRKLVLCSWKLSEPLAHHVYLFA